MIIIISISKQFLIDVRAASRETAEVSQHTLLISCVFKDNVGHAFEFQPPCQIVTWILDSSLHLYISASGVLLALDLSSFQKML